MALVEHETPRSEAPAIDAALARAVVRDAVHRYAESRRAQVEAFVDRHFSLHGSLRLHGHAVGWDMLRAPANLTLSAPYLATRIVATGSRTLRLTKTADWLDSRRLYLATDVSREIEWLIFTELFELPYQQGDRRFEHDALAEEVLSDPRIDAALESGLAGAGKRSHDPRFRQWLRESLTTYEGTRVSAADFSNALISAGVGAAAFKQLTPGMMSLGPVAAHAIVQSAAVSSFPLGAGLGGVWYGLFPAAAPAAMTIGMTGGLMAFAAVLAAFSGVVTDPVQRKLGLHQRRLRKLIDCLETELGGEGESRFTVRDHYVARLLDVFEGLNVAYRAAF